jgi:hypothetical protein
VISALEPDAELLGLLKIDRADLEANRAGRLGVGQRRRRRSQARMFLLAGLVLGGLFVAGGKMSAGNGGQWFVPVLIGVVIFAFATLRAITLLRSADIPVRRLTGPVSTQLVRMGRAGTAFKLVVDGERCDLPRRVRSSDRRWREALTDRPYHVYVVGKLPSVVGIELA